MAPSTTVVPSCVTVTAVSVPQTVLPASVSSSSSVSVTTPSARSVATISSRAAGVA
nr:hypothetical protein QSJ49_07865 [Halobacterium salinarum]